MMATVFPCGLGNSMANVGVNRSRWRTPGPLRGRADVIYNRDEKVYVSWEEGSVDWGKEFRGPLKERDKLNDDYGPLHRFRLVRLAEFRRNGSIHQIPVPMPSFHDAKRREGRGRKAGAAGRFL